MCIHVLSFSFHLHAFSFHSAFMSFHFISKALEIGSMAWPGDWVQHMIITKLSLRLSLNNPSNIWHCSKEICHKNDKEREREREPASWMPNDMVTAGNTAPQVEFPSSVLPGLWMCTPVFAWFRPSLMDCRVWSQVLSLLGGLSLYSVSCTSLTKNTCNTKVVFNHFDRDSYVYIYRNNLTINKYITYRFTTFHHALRMAPLAAPLRVPWRSLGVRPPRAAKMDRIPQLVIFSWESGGFNHRIWQYFNLKRMKHQLSWTIDGLCFSYQNDQGNPQKDLFGDRIRTPRETTGNEAFGPINPMSLFLSQSTNHRSLASNFRLIRLWWKKSSSSW